MNNQKKSMDHSAMDHDHMNHDHMDHNQMKHDSMNHGEMHHDHSSHHQMMIADFKKRLLVSTILTIPIIILSPTIQSWLSYSLSFGWSKWVLLVLASAVFFYGGWPFLKGSVNEIKTKQIGMMTLIALAISVAYLYSVATLFGLSGKDFFWELATLILIMLLGHWIEMRSVVKASSALDELAKLLPDTAHVVDGDELHDMAANQVKENAIVRVLPGEKVALDGVIVSGETSVDESILTGESKPASKKKGDEVIAGSLNGSGSIDVKITHTSSDSYISKVIQIVRDAQNAKSKTQNFTDKAAFVLTLVAITAGITTFVVWLIVTKDLAFAVTRMATVMVITCPHALGLAIPLVVANSTTLAAKHGLLIRNRTAFEESRNVDIMVFDKTGTLTVGEFALVDITSFDDQMTDKDLLGYAASLEASSEHPIAQAFLTRAKKDKIKLQKVSKFNALKGKGIEGVQGKQTIQVVSEAYIKDKGLDVPKHSKSGTLAYLVIDDQLKGSFLLKDDIRKESKTAIEKLQTAGIECWMLTGDNETVAKDVATELGLDGYFAEVLPHEKQAKIKALQAKHKTVAMTGDGVNDAPALAQADIGIAVGSGTDVAVETSDIVLVNSNPLDIVDLTFFGKRTYSKMIQNIIWATGYNVIAIPLAAGVLYNQGIVISPAIGAILMSLSTVIVAINAKRLSFTKKMANS